MKRNTWQIVFLGFATYLIFSAAFPLFNWTIGPYLILSIVLGLFGISKKNYIVIFLSLGFLSIYLQKYYGFLPIRVYPFIIGVAIIRIAINGWSKPNSSIIKGESSSETQNITFNPGDYIDIQVICSERTEYATSKNLKKVNITPVLSAICLDMTLTTFSKPSISCTANVFLGNIQVWIPKNCQIVNHISPILGNVFLSTPEKDTPLTLHLYGNCTLASIEIRYE